MRRLRRLNHWTREWPRATMLIGALLILIGFGALEIIDTIKYGQPYHMIVETQEFYGWISAPFGMIVIPIGLLVVFLGMWRTFEYFEAPTN